MQFSVDRVTVLGRPALRVRGELDIATAPRLAEAVASQLSQQPQAMVVDLTGTTFLDSTALGVLIGTVKRLRARDGRLTLVNTDANIARTFDITGLDQIFTICDTREEAIAALDRAES